MKFSDIQMGLRVYLKLNPCKKGTIIKWHCENQMQEVQSLGYSGVSYFSTGAPSTISICVKWDDSWIEPNWLTPSELIIFNNAIDKLEDVL